MTLCKRCQKQFEKDEHKYLNDVHWHCLTYDEQMEATIMDMVKTERCGHNNTHTVKFCTDCGKRVS